MEYKTLEANVFSEHDTAILNHKVRMFVRLCGWRISFDGQCGDFWVVKLYRPKKYRKRACEKREACAVIG